MVDRGWCQGIIEKQYHLRAYGFSMNGRSSPQPAPDRRVGHAAEYGDGEHAPRQVAKSIETGLIDVNKKQDEAKDLMLQRGLTREYPKERAQEFFKRLQALLEEFDAFDTENEEDQTYGMMIAFYPMVLRVPKGIKRKKEPAPE